MNKQIVKLIIGEKRQKIMRVKLLQRAEAFDEYTKKVHPTKNGSPVNACVQLEEYLRKKTKKTPVKSISLFRLL